MENNLPDLELDGTETIALAVALLFLGMLLKRRLPALDRFMIPSPLLSCLLYALVAAILELTGVIRISLDTSVQSLFFMIFFAAIGYQIDLRLLRHSLGTILLFGIGVALLILLQDGIALGMGQLFAADPLTGMCSGSISLMGGDGFARFFGPDLSALRVENATALCLGSSTAGMIVGAVLSGLIGHRLITAHKLRPGAPAPESLPRKAVPGAPGYPLRLTNAIYQLVLALGLGNGISDLLCLGGLSLPDYLCVFVCALILRSIGTVSGAWRIYSGELSLLGTLALSIFVGMDFMSISLVQLLDLNLTQLTILIVQILATGAFVLYVLFRLLDRNYDSALLCAGTMGFGIGSTSCGMASLMVLTARHGPSIQAFLLVPIVGIALSDLINSFVIYCCLLNL